MHRDLNPRFRGSFPWPFLAFSPKGFFLRVFSKRVFFFMACVRCEKTGKKWNISFSQPFLLISSFFRISVKEILFGLHEWNIQEL